MTSEDAHKHWLSKAIELARESLQEGGGPFGAVLVKDGREVARGKNRVTLWNDPTAHAEVTAIREATRLLGHYFLEDCILYSSCEPCPMCLGAIYWARIKAVYFAGTRHDAAAAGFSDALIYEELSRPHDRRRIPFYRLENPESHAVFDIWMQRPDRTDY